LDRIPLLFHDRWSSEIPQFSTRDYDLSLYPLLTEHGSFSDFFFAFETDRALDFLDPKE